MISKGQPSTDPLLFCLPFVPLPSLDTTIGYEKWKLLSKWKKPAYNARWDDEEIKEICFTLCLPLPRRILA